VLPTVPMLRIHLVVQPEVASVLAVHTSDDSLTEREIEVSQADREWLFEQECSRPFAYK